jgi:hypothetical protein
MKYSFIVALCSTALFLIASSCTKHLGDVEEHTPKATIQFSSPTDGALLSTGDSLSVQAVAISTETIHGYDVQIKDPADTTVYFSKHVHDHNDTLVIHENWKPVFNKPTNVQVLITLTLDHDGHTSTGKVNCRVQ